MGFGQKLELPLIKITSLVLALGSGAAIIVNNFNGLSPAINYVAGIGLVGFGAIFFCVDHIRNFGILKNVFTSLTLIFINSAWFFNYGFSASITILFVLWFAFMILIWSKKGVFFWSFLIFLNLIVLFIVEIKYPELVGEYPSVDARVIDTFFSLIIALALSLHYLVYIKRNYLKEYHRAQKSDQLKTSFIANLSHEIRTPLNSIMGFSELLMDPDERDDIEERLGLIFTNSVYLQSLIEDILDLAKIESGQFSLNMTSGNINGLLLDITKEYQAAALLKFKRVIQVDCSIPDDEIVLNSDFKRIEQVIRNLMENAMKFTRVGTIQLMISDAPQKVIITVRDTGIGIEPDNLSLVFQRFVKIDQSLVSNIRGLGIGLFLCKQLVENLGGDIWVNSIYGEGTTFSFSIPK